MKKISYDLEKEEMIMSKYDELLAIAEYREQLRKNPDLKYLFFELTDCCNMSCLHCGSNCTSKNNTYLSYEAICKVLDEVADAYKAKQIIVVLTGGEPLLHKDFFKITEYINEKGFRWGMTTNGTLINEEIAKKLIAHKLGSVSISIDGLKHQHEMLRQFKGGFDLAVKGIKKLLEVRNIELVVQITTVISKLNYDSLEEIYLLAKSIGVDSFRPINIEPIGRAKNNANLLLDDEQYYGLMEFIAEKRKVDHKMEVTFGCSHYLGEQFEKEVRKYGWLCGSGIYVASVLCNGDIYSCLDIERREELVQGNIFEDSFVEVWQNRFEWFRSDRTKLNSICGGCDQKTICAADSTHCWDFENNQPAICLYQILKKEKSRRESNMIGKKKKEKDFTQRMDNMPAVIYGPPEMLEERGSSNSLINPNIGMAMGDSFCVCCGRPLQLDFNFCPYCGEKKEKVL